MSKKATHVKGMFQLYIYCNTDFNFTPTILKIIVENFGNKKQETGN